MLSYDTDKIYPVDFPTAKEISYIPGLSNMVAISHKLL